MSRLDIFASDLDINFDRNLFTNDVNLLTGDAAIRRALKSLMLLKPNEKPFHPEIDTGIAGLLFENATPVTIAEAKRRIEGAIMKYEPRVDSAKVDLQYNESINTLVVKILYTIKNVNKVFTSTVSLERIR